MINLITKLLVTVFTLALFAAPIAHAKEGSVRDNVKTHRVASQKALEAFKSGKNDNPADKLKALITFGDRVVEQRQKALDEVKKRVDSGRCSKIDATTKSSISSSVATMKATLTSQKATIDASTTLEDAKKNIAAVYEQNRVFAHFIPALNGICASQRVIDLVNSKFAAAITEMKAAGKDTTALEAELSKAKTAALAAQDLYEKVVASPSGSEAKTNLTSAKAKLKEAKAALESAKKLLVTERDTNKSSE